MILTSFDYYGHQVLCHIGRTEKEKALADKLNALSRAEVMDIANKRENTQKGWK